CMQGRHFPLTF
nr:immunoglobulin light chain junction region [Macaca mulatta]MOW64463.1 immunoglobulin light chain junction region [Macaca mulatta]